MSLKTKIKLEISRCDFKETNTSEFYIVDYKNINKGGVELLIEEPQNIDGIKIQNSSNLEILFFGFKDNALHFDVGNHIEQCECILFPKIEKDTNWILFIEIKNTDTIKKAKEHYPEKMLSQVISTVDFFRKKEIIPVNKRVHAIVSFPSLLKNFSAYFFPNGNTPLTYILSHKIEFLPTNFVDIISNKRIKISQNQ